ncbi:MAG: hypothetical protein ACJAWV_003596 [Flammeovirgaceae bacterium]|jgi:hypothetical protein
MRKTLFLLSFLFLNSVGFCQTELNAVQLSYYLPNGINYDSKIPKPAEVLGHEVGDWHVTHDKLVFYMRTLAERSDRVQIQEYGRTFENRPLLLLTISSPKNLQNVEQIREKHLELGNPDKSGGLDTEKMPSVVWLGYSVHGNESSGSNASLLVAYHLASAQGAEIEKLLENTVILIDPSINPDGLNRFASWVNTHKSKHLVTDPSSREFNEPFPRGRTNHYWFDLNRDWLPVQLPESQGRIAQFQNWKPNILTDHHEMGTNSTFFFQPGIPSRKNPLTPQRNVDLTAKIAKYHAKALDKIGSLYYSEESFDDFYYGKGSTYPDIQGSIGILFEQASSRGHAQESQHGVVTFPFTIRNQFTASLSTLQASLEMRKELLDYQRDFYKNAVAESKQNNTKAYIFGEKYDQTRLNEFVKMLRRHNIKIHQLKKNYKDFEAENSFVVPLNQPQNRLIQAMFRTQTEFNDSLFYDVSAWTLPMAFNLDYEEIGAKAFSADLLGEQVLEVKYSTGKLMNSEKVTAGYAFRWDDYNAPKLAYSLMESGVMMKVASEPFTGNTAEGELKFDYGTILIPSKQAKFNQADLEKLLATETKETGIAIQALTTGLTSKGIDFGSSSFVKLELPKVAILAGNRLSSYDVGETWHLLDQRVNMPISVVDIAQFNRADLSKYNVIVLPNGSYSGIDASAISNLKTWVRKGGTIIGIQRGSTWAKSVGLAKVEFKKQSKPDSTGYRPYSKLSQDLGSKRIGGAIFQAELDLTHPLCYGFQHSTMPIFRNDTQFALKSKNAFATPVRYTENPLLSGYIHKKHLEMIGGSAGILVNSYGQGRTISFLQNPNFRAFWYGTNKLFLNAVFFGNTISGRAGR